jgi:hypothetical protein
MFYFLFGLAVSFDLMFVAWSLAISMVVIRLTFF